MHLRKKAQQLLEKDLDLLAKRDYKSIKKQIRLNSDQLDTLIDLVKTLDPNPAGRFSQGDVDYIKPDVYVKKVKGRWLVTHNSETLPAIQVNDSYAELVSDSRTDKAAADYIKNNLQQYGEEAMKPMVLKGLGRAIRLARVHYFQGHHQKIPAYTRGIYEFKFFFSSHVNTEAGGECSATAIRP
ncbi:RNA polymerase sigma-54 factor-like [Oratosquilla oratoria]|uniref:RNA polymerase sigma-54 factor-like n=1 Tax=Oratosquilla oratoria TaxID=337810 RepID=UPI003F76DE41